MYSAHRKGSTPTYLAGQAMIFRFFILLVGFGLAVVGGVSMLAYLNLVTAGYSFVYYLKFIGLRVEFYIFILGFILIFLSIYTPFSKR